MDTYLATDKGRGTGLSALTSLAGARKKGGGESDAEVVTTGSVQILRKKHYGQATNKRINETNTSPCQTKEKKWIQERNLKEGLAGIIANNPPGGDDLSLCLLRRPK